MTMKKHLLTLTLATSMAAASAGLAMAEDANKGVDHQNPVADPATPNSGPGVQGAPDTRTGPATRAPGGNMVEEGDGDGTDGTTQPSQDSTGVQGPPDTRTGPATRAPGEGGAQ